MSGARLPAPWGSRLDRDRPLALQLRGRGATKASPATPWPSRPARQRRRRAVALVQVSPPARRADPAPATTPTARPGRRRAERARPTAAARGGHGGHGPELSRQPRLTTATPGSAVSRASCRSASTTRRSIARRAAGRYWERYIRAKAGLGRLSTATPRTATYDKAYLFADVAVVGGGPAGLARPQPRPAGGRDVVLIDDEPELGGSLLYARSFPAAACFERADCAAPRAAANAARARPDRRHLHRPVRRQLAGRRAGQPPVQAARQRGRAGHRRDRAAAWCSATTTCPA